MSALSIFIEQLNEQDQLANGDESFIGEIVYEFRSQELKETLKVTIHLTTMEYGQVSIEEGEILNSDRVHMTFKSDFQEYQFDSEGYLVIKGKSRKIGDYQVKIKQV